MPSLRPKHEILRAESCWRFSRNVYSYNAQWKEGQRNAAMNGGVHLPIQHSEAEARSPTWGGGGLIVSSSAHTPCPIKPLDWHKSKSRSSGCSKCHHTFNQAQGLWSWLWGSALRINIVNYTHGFMVCRHCSFFVFLWCLIIIFPQMQWWEFREMAQKLRLWVALLENSGFIPNIHAETHSHL